MCKTEDKNDFHYTQQARYAICNTRKMRRNFGTDIRQQKQGFPYNKVMTALHNTISYAHILSTSGGDAVIYIPPITSFVQEMIFPMPLQ